VNNQQAIMFRILDVQNFDEDQPIFIHDIQNGVYVNLRENNYEINLPRSEEHTSELQSRENLVCRLLLEKKNKKFPLYDLLKLILEATGTVRSFKFKDSAPSFCGWAQTPSCSLTR